MAEKGSYTLDAVAQQVQSWKAQGLKVVFTNGVFTAGAAAVMMMTTTTTLGVTLLSQT